MPDPKIVWHDQSVTRQQRELLNGNRGCVVWFTGLSGSGKSTVANLVDVALHQAGAHSFLLDGDNVRHSLNATPKLLETVHGAEFARRFGLTFSAQDREENIRRVGSVAKLFAEAGLVTLTAFVSPFRQDRERVRMMLPTADFIEVFVDTPLDVCERRDPKGLYRNARAEIAAGRKPGMTGLDDPYEPPMNPELVLAGGNHSAQVLAGQVMEYLRQSGKLAIQASPS